VAVLLGDYIISQALYMLSDYQNAEVMRTMMRAVKDMSEGELRQITASRDGIISEDDYFKVIQHKTSSLMAAVCKMPTQVLDGPPELSEAMYSFGFNFGMAFQIVDDLLDFVADEQRLGKPILGDIREGKATLPTIYMLNRLGANQASRVGKILEERQLRDGDKAWLLETVRSSGATDYCQEVARDFTTRAKTALDICPDSEYKKSMFDLCDYVLERER
jgi:octaprenyl-diphosphate synthase